MDRREIQIKRVEKATYEDPHRERDGYADRANNSLNSKLFAYGLDGHFEELLYSHIEGGVVLDIACGVAPWAEDQLNRNLDLEWVGVDLSNQSIQKARSRIKHSKSSFVIGDAEYLPFQSNRFDTIVSSAALHHLPNWDELVLNELRRVMKDDSVLVFREPLKYNPLAYISRRISPGPYHTPYEHPFPYYTFKNKLSEKFQEVNIKSHHIACLLIPFLAGITGITPSEKMAKLTYDLEEYILKGPVKGLGMHMTGVAKKPR